MSDPVDVLEQAIHGVLERCGHLSLLPHIYQAIDQWRSAHGGIKSYIARRSETRRNGEVARLAAAGARPAEIAREIGISERQARRIRSRKSPYLI